MREEVQAKGPAIDSFLNRYRDLTQHNPSLVDPVMRAVREDWEELLGQIENLLEEREQNLQASRELQEAQNTMDDDLENYVKELERIEKEDVAVQEKSLQLKVCTGLINYFNSLHDKSWVLRYCNLYILEFNCLSKITFTDIWDDPCIMRTAIISQLIL